MSAARVLDDIRNLGGLVILDGDELRLRIPKSAPRNLIAAARASKADLIALLRNNPTSSISDFEERTALVEYGAGVPREWAEGFARLDCTDPPPGFSPSRWRQIIGDGGLFLDKWAKQAAALGWTAVDVFGVNPAAPAVRYDGMGLVPLIGGNRVIAISADSAKLESAAGNIQTFRRYPRRGSVALWEV